jgi:predicted negative regulator of RcsB-dependent stress response
MVKKIEVKELKQPDKLQTAFFNFMQFISSHRQKAYLISAMAGIILLLIGGYYLYHLDYEKKAAHLLTKAFNEKLKSTQTKDADFNPVNIYQEVTSTYPRSRAARLANYQMGNHYFENGDIDKAIHYYTTFLSRTSDEDDMKTLAYTGLGYCHEAKNDLKKALDFFQKAASTKEGKIFAVMTNRNIGRIYEQMKENAKAVEFFKKALADATDPAVQLLLKRKIATLS